MSGSTYCAGMFVAVDAAFTDPEVGISGIAVQGDSVAPQLIPGPRMRALEIRPR
jgi:hypothetical protein